MGAFMQHEFAAVIEQDGDWFVAYAPEVPGANGQGRSRDQALRSLSEAIALILDDRREEGLRGVPDEAERTTVRVPA
jgi:predicted RNase H-like HicB family nuclease